MTVADVKKDREEATIWVQGLDRICRACGIRFCMDLSATPFYIKGSGYPEGEPFPWIVSDFGLVDATESGITKIPRLPVSDTTGQPDPKYFRLWRNITQDLVAGQRLSNKRPKPEMVWERSHVNAVVLDNSWEQTAAFYLEQQADHVFCYVRNDRPFLLIPYEYEGAQHHFEPDYLVRLKSGKTLVLEMKGKEDEQDRAKYQAARRWITAVNNWGRLGVWDFKPCRDPQTLPRLVADLGGR